METHCLGGKESDLGFRPVGSGATQVKMPSEWHKLKKEVQVRRPWGTSPWRLYVDSQKEGRLET